MSLPPPAPIPLLVVCLCAQWCGACREYRSTFDQAADMFPDMRFLWVDVEDQADLVDPIEVENFPTLLIAAGTEPRFFGPVMPHKETLVRLLRAQLDATTGPAAPADPELHALVTRMQALGAE